MTAITIAPSALPTTMSTRLRWRRRAARSRSSRIRSRAAARPDLLMSRGLPGGLVLAARSWHWSLLHWGHRPNSSMVWSTAVKPASAATCSAQRSTARPSTSTLVPQVRQMR